MLTRERRLALGRRTKDGNLHAGHWGREWKRDRGALSGRRNTEEVLTVVGALAGGVIGKRSAIVRHAR